MSQHGSSVRRSLGRLKRHLKWLQNQKPGSLPGVIVPPEGAQKTRVRHTVYSQGGMTSEWVRDPKADLTTSDPSQKTWIEVTGLADSSWISRMGEVFDIHPLALEDISSGHHSPKLDVYGEALFVIVRLITNSEHCETEQVSLWLAPGVLISFHEKESAYNELIRDRIGQRLGRLRDSGVDFLAYAMLDALVDTNYLVADDLVERIEQLDDEIASSDFTSQTIHMIRMLRHDLLIARRTIWPTRDVLNQLMRDPHPVIRPETRTFLKDCYDHTIQLIELIEIYREMCADLRDYYLSMINLRANEIMKVLTIIATIFIPLSFITGLYGMNFDRKYPWNMPELSWAYGYPFALGLMGLTAIGLLSFFRWKRWL